MLGREIVCELRVLIDETRVAEGYAADLSGNCRCARCACRAFDIEAPALGAFDADFRTREANALDRNVFMQKCRQSHAELYFGDRGDIHATVANAHVLEGQVQAREEAQGNRTRD